MNLKKIGKVLTSKFVGTGPSSYEKKNLPGSGLTKVEKRWSNGPWGIVTPSMTPSPLVKLPSFRGSLLPPSSRTNNNFFYRDATALPSGPRPPHCRGYTITLRHTTLGRTPLDEWPARCRDLYLTTHNTHNKYISMPLAGFEPTIPASERQQTHALDRTTTGIGNDEYFVRIISETSYLPTDDITGDFNLYQHPCGNLKSRAMDLKQI